MTSTQKLLLITGFVIILLAFAWPWVSKIPFGKLPGDVFFKRGNTSLYLPIATCILLSLLFSIVIHFIRKLLQ
jgi:hypothetical protein